LLESIQGREVLVTGDVILDRFLWGSVDRISPEAPVPVVRVVRESVHLGGAANVAANLATLGARPILVGVVGEDAAAASLRDAARSGGVSTDLVADPGRPTTTKTRVLARSQQVVRVDREADRGPSAKALEALGEILVRRVAEVAAVVVSDYAKGTVDPLVLAPLLSRSRERGIPVVVDPKPPRLDLYQPITVITPNQAEASRLSGLEIGSDADCAAAADRLLSRIDTDAVLVTRGEEGMMLLQRGSGPVFVRAAAREVFDVTGAGDTVAAVVAAALAAGAALEEAMRLANHAGGVAVGRVGTAAVRPEEILAHLEAAPDPET
jgi:D-beta-D-heptose 7-phosphate kinase/D-beta-D-heptose 1-phosphate adenosyltransferase